MKAYITNESIIIGWVNYHDIRLVEWCTGNEQEMIQNQTRLFHLHPLDSPGIAQKPETNYGIDRPNLISTSTLLTFDIWAISGWVNYYYDLLGNDSESNTTCLSRPSWFTTHWTGY